MPSRSVLVFPAGMPPSLTWARRALENGIRIVGASSLTHDPARDNYPDWTCLPWIGDSSFAEALGRCLTEKQIDTVYTPHPVVWSMLRNLLPTLTPKTRLEPAEPWKAELADYRAYRAMADSFARRPLEIAGCLNPAKPLSRLQTAALIRAFHNTPGECGDAKLEALIAVFRRMPRGDVVEIGSLWGRSAVALAFLAKHYGIGHLLCVDPWRGDEMHQGIPDVDAIFDAAPLDDIFEAFRINLAPFFGRVNYSRSRSVDAAVIYGAGCGFATHDFGETKYAGAIALLHIDGNHALEAVRSDVAAWRRFVCKGGWIVMDDYCWTFGSGPRMAADELLIGLGDRLATAFVAGDALFVKVGR